MKRISLIIFTIATLVLLSCTQPASKTQVEKKEVEPETQVVTSKAEWSEEESEEIAKKLLQNSPTFKSRGIEDSLKLIASIPLEQPFEWQFDYKFNCWCSEYGRLGSEPTPQDTTPHQAQIVVGQGEVTYAVIDEEWDVLLETSIKTSSQEERPTGTPGGNEVSVSFIEESNYRVSGDSFTNKEVATERWWRTNLLNLSDETGEPVTGLKLSLESDISFEGKSEGIEKDQMTRIGPPTYEWSLGDVPDGKTIATNGWPWDAFVFSQSFPGKLAPGYDVSRSFDKTVFLTQGIQTLTITFIPREESIDTVTIYVHTDEDQFVNPVVLSYFSNSGGEVKIEQSGHRSEIRSVSVELNTPLTVTVTIQVTPKVPLVQYKPGTGINTERITVPENGITTGSSVSYTTEVGTWTWSAEGDYVWNWGVRAASDVNISFGRSSSIPISIWILLTVVILGATILGIILYRRRRKRVST